MSNKLFRLQVLGKIAAKISLKDSPPKILIKGETLPKMSIKESVSIGREDKSVLKEAAIYDDVKKSLEEKGYKEENKPVYDGAIKIPGAKPGVAVICPSNPIIGGKYNVFFQIRSGNAPASAGVNTIIVIAEAGGMASKENTEAFGNKDWINKQLGMIHVALVKKFGDKISLGKLGLGSFSGGYAAVGKILEDPEMKQKVDSVVILDGIHGGERGKPDPTKMKVWLDYAKEAKENPSKNFVFLYTAVDPGTYASTSDSAYYLTDNLNIQRNPIKGKTYAGVEPASIASAGGFTAIQLYDRKSDKPGYGYQYYADNRPGSMGHQHVQAAKALPEIWNEYLADSWNAG
jgi:hypothetical protein